MDPSSKEAGELARKQEIGHIVALSDCRAMCDTLNEPLNTLDSATEKLLGALGGIDMQCSARLGPLWRDAGDEDLTVKAVSGPRIELRNILTRITQFFKCSSALWNNAPPSDIKGAAMLFRGESPDAEAYLSNLTEFSKTYVVYSTERPEGVHGLGLVIIWICYQAIRQLFLLLSETVCYTVTDISYRCMHACMHAFVNLEIVFGRSALCAHQLSNLISRARYREADKTEGG